jgi:hypothetical protein
MTQWLAFGMVVGAIALGVTAPSARATLFDFNAAGPGSGMPLVQITDGITATFSGGYFVQTPGSTILVTPAGFDGYCLVPTSVYGSDLTITFDQTITDFSIVLAPHELACDSSATLRGTAYMNSTLLGHNDSVAAQPGTWPSETLTYSDPAGFNKVVVHYQSPPPTGGDYGVIFVADNVNVTAAPVSIPEPANLGMLGIGTLALIRRRRR